MSLPVRTENDGFAVRGPDRRALDRGIEREASLETACHVEGPDIGRQAGIEHDGRHVAAVRREIQFAGIGGIAAQHSSLYSSAIEPRELRVQRGAAFIDEDATLRYRKPS